MNKGLINPWTWQDAYGYSQAIEVSGHTRVLRTSGIASADEGGEFQHAGDIAAQIALALDNIEAVLSEAGMSLSNVVRLGMYTTDVDAFNGAYGIVAQRLAAAGCVPAMKLLGVARLADPRMMVLFEATAVA